MRRALGIVVLASGTLLISGCASRAHLAGALAPTSQAIALSSTSSQTPVASSGSPISSVPPAMSPASSAAYPVAADGSKVTSVWLGADLAATVAAGPTRFMSMMNGPSDGPNIYDGVVDLGRESIEYVTEPLAATVLQTGGHDYLCDPAIGAETSSAPEPCDAAHPWLMSDGGDGANYLKEFDSFAPAGPAPGSKLATAVPRMIGTAVIRGVPTTGYAFNARLPANGAITSGAAQWEYWIDARDLVREFELQITTTPVAADPQLSLPPGLSSADAAEMASSLPSDADARPLPNPSMQADEDAFKAAAPGGTAGLYAPEDLTHISVTIISQFWNIRSEPVITAPPADAVQH